MERGQRWIRDRTQRCRRHEAGGTFVCASSIIRSDLLTSDPLEDRGLGLAVDQCADDADDEHILLAWAMRELHQHAYLDRSSLGTEAGWAVDDQVNLAAVDLMPEEMARIWEAAHRGYRLSYAFLARIVRIDVDRVPDGAPVVATRFNHTDEMLRPRP